MKYIGQCLVLVSCTVGANFINDPVCPPASQQGSCAGRRSTCWSPGVRDTDCPGHGLCCFDGCANTCATGTQPSASKQQSVVIPSRPPPPPPPAPKTHKPPKSYNPAPPPENTYIPPAPKPVVLVPVPSYFPPAPQFEAREPSGQVEVALPPPVNHLVGGSCPRVPPLSRYECAGRYSSCWSVGVSDLDCPNWGLCCFDGCANTCLDSNPAPSPPPTQPPAPRTDPPRNPCDPNPCGPGSMCVPQQGEPECKCPPGLVPNPTAKQGCTVPNPCDPNPCGPGSMCIPQEGQPMCKCPKGLVPDPTPEVGCRTRDPCLPSPCGPGTTCTPNRDGNPVCTCLPGLIPKPDTITGCGPECEADPDCSRGFVCRDRKCMEKPDPCSPSPCGPGTTCTPNREGNPICKCLPNLIPKPDTITGCGPECVVDPDCGQGYICSQQSCVEKPDPCVPNPCGEGALCLLQGESFSCECPAGTVGNGRTGCNRGECLVNEDCSLQKACQNYYCVDPCQSGTCSSTDFCRVMQHIPICGYNYDPPQPEPKDEFVIGAKYSPEKPLPKSNKVVIGATHHEAQLVPESRNQFVVGGVDPQTVPRCGVGSDCLGSQLMMMMMDTSNLPVIGASFNRRKRRGLSMSRYFK